MERGDLSDVKRGDRADVERRDRQQLVFHITLAQACTLERLFKAQIHIYS